MTVVDTAEETHPNCQKFVEDHSWVTWAEVATPLEQRNTTRTGPCANCRTTIERYGEGGRPLCDQCELRKGRITRALRRHLTADQIAQLIGLLMAEDGE